MYFNILHPPKGRNGSNHTEILYGNILNPIDIFLKSKMAAGLYTLFQCIWYGMDGSSTRSDRNDCAECMSCFCLLCTKETIYLVDFTNQLISTTNLWYTHNFLNLIWDFYPQIIYTFLSFITNVKSLGFWIGWISGFSSLISKISFFLDWILLLYISTEPSLIEKGQ